MLDRVDIAKYLDRLCDPLDRGSLRLDYEQDQPRLISETSQLQYRYVGAFPDLRPGRGIPLENGGRRVPFGTLVNRTHEQVRHHYDEKPCTNYMALDNVPLGRYLRDPAYDEFFEGVEFLVDVGCSKGATSRLFKEYRGITPFCIDLAYGSLRYVRAEPLHADGVLGSNMCLPMRDAVADMVVSYGVIHLTPDPLRCFTELARILKPGGRLLLNVYNWDNIFRHLHSVVSSPLKLVRHALGRRTGDTVLKSTVFLPYHLILWGILGAVQGNWRFPDITNSYEEFSHYFLTPVARFYQGDELRTFGELCGLKVVEHETGGFPGNSFAHFVWYQKQ